MKLFWVLTLVSFSAAGATFEKAKFSAQLDGRVTKVNKEDAFLGGASWFVRVPYVDFGLGAGLMLNSTTGLSADAAENSGNISYANLLMDVKIFESPYLQLDFGVSRGTLSYTWDVQTSDTTYASKKVTAGNWEFGPNIVIPAGITSVKLGYSKRILSNRDTVELAKKLQGSSYQVSLVNYF
jgi:hypothetical protein